MFDYNQDTGEIWIYDEIGPAWRGMVDAVSVTNAIRELKGQALTVRLNTPGGSIDEGIAIYNAIKRHDGPVTTVVDSIAASMGSYLLQAGSERVVAHNSMVMVHEPWTIAVGNAAEMRKEAEVLDKYADRMVPDYAAATGRTEDEIRNLMAEETWMTGEEIVELGFADRMEGEAIEPAAIKEGIFKKTPAKLLQPAQSGTRTTFYPHREAARYTAAKL